MRRIAVLMTCHNRRAKTVACLEMLFAQSGRGELFGVTVFLVDAGSTDGTASEVRCRFPDVQVVNTDASVFWGTGMAMAERAARGNRFDYHLWLNDDVELRSDAMARLLESADRQRSAEHIVVGQLVDQTGTASYGGFRIGRRPLDFVPIGVSDDDRSCDALNGNVVLVAVAAAARLGSLDSAFPHAIGDIDYGLRARAAGIAVVQAGGVHGECDRNPPPRSASSPSRRERLAGVMNVKNLPPRAWWTFCRRHAGALAPAYFVRPYLEAFAGAKVPREVRSSAEV
jgi:GT2 family glycosyltransferase